jgi:hypothetical protein
VNSKIVKVVQTCALLALFAGLPNGRVKAETIISVSSPDYEGWCVIYSGQGYRVGWTQADTYDAVSVSAKLGSGGPTDQTGRAYLTTQIGPGTSVSNQIAFTYFTFPSEPIDLPLFQGLHLPPGSYYLSIIGDSSTWGSQWATGSATNATSAPDVLFLEAFGASGAMNDYFPASPFYSEGFVRVEFTVQGIGITHPALRITQSGNSVQISWSTNSVGFVLQAADVLNSTNWQAIAAAPIESSGNFMFSTNANGAQFYRLKKQID